LHFELILHLLISKKEQATQFEPQMEEAIVNNAPFGRGEGFDWVTEVTFQTGAQFNVMTTLF
jgi:hypothetical protein